MMMDELRGRESHSIFRMQSNLDRDLDISISPKDLEWKIPPRRSWTLFYRSKNIPQ
jgi:hypothetical protein